MPPIIFSMHRMNRTFPPGKQVLKDISLSFFEGAKIGIVGHRRHVGRKEIMDKLEEVLA